MNIKIRDDHMSCTLSITVATNVVPFDKGKNADKNKFIASGLLQLYLLFEYYGILEIKSF